MARPRTKTNIGTKAPTKEIGGVLQGALSISGMTPWTQWEDDVEFVPELKWPRSVRMYESMRTDSQVSALYNATLLAILKFDWSIDPNGADDGAVHKLSEDYNLPIKGEKVNKRMRAKRRFAFRDHLRKAMHAGIYGHYYFEQVGYIGPDGLWHLRKLAERPPRTIQLFRVASDGGLISIVQNINPSNSLMTPGPSYAIPGQLPEIPIDVLVGYVWEQEGANWTGRSWFRDLYKNWLIKDRLVRIDAVNHERAGGVPYIEAHPGATYAEIQQLNEMARGFRIGDTAGGAVPAGAKFQIARGTNSSVVESMKYHDEAMARKFMLMIIQLGQTKTGSRALGTTFVDFWGGGLEAIAHWFCDTFNEHVIEDDIDWNYGEDVDQVPLLDFDFDPELVVQDLVQLIEAKAILVDDDLEDALRKEMHLPERGKPRIDPATQAQMDLDQQALDKPAPAPGQPGAKPAPKAPGSQQPAKAAASGDDEGAPSHLNRLAAVLDHDEEE